MMKCLKMMQILLHLCEFIGCTISSEETEWPKPLMVFLGMLLNGLSKTITLPQEKIDKARYLLKTAIDIKKVTVNFIQKLTSKINFLNRAIIPGRAFTRGMYSKLCTKTKSGESLKLHHHIYLNADFIQDCHI